MRPVVVLLRLVAVHLWTLPCALLCRQASIVKLRDLEPFVDCQVPQLLALGDGVDVGALVAAAIVDHPLVFGSTRLGVDGTEECVTIARERYV